MNLLNPSLDNKLITNSKYLAALFNKKIGSFLARTPEPWMLVFEFLALRINHHRGRLVALQQSPAHL
jgi:hypothetical protein